MKRKILKLLQLIVLLPLMPIIGIPGDGGDDGDDGQKAPQPDDDGKDDGKPDSKLQLTQEELSVMMAKEKNQGRLSVLAELGIEDASKTKEVKESLQKYKEYVDSQKTELEKTQEELETEKSKSLNLESQKIEMQQKFELLTLGVKIDCVEDFLALAKNKVTDEKDLKTVTEEMKEKYSSFFIDSTEQKGGTGNNINPGKKIVKTEGIGERLAKSVGNNQKESNYFKN